MSSATASAELAVLAEAALEISAAANTRAGALRSKTRSTRIAARADADARAASARADETRKRRKSGDGYMEKKKFRGTLGRRGEGTRESIACVAKRQRVVRVCALKCE